MDDIFGPPSSAPSNSQTLHEKPKPVIQMKDPFDPFDFGPITTSTTVPTIQQQSTNIPDPFGDFASTANQTNTTVQPTTTAIAPPPQEDDFGDEVANVLPEISPHHEQKQPDPVRNNNIAVAEIDPFGDFSSSKTNQIVPVPQIQEDEFGDEVATPIVNVAPEIPQQEQQPELDFGDEVVANHKVEQETEQEKQVANEFGEEAATPTFAAVQPVQEIIVNNEAQEHDDGFGDFEQAVVVVAEERKNEEKIEVAQNNINDNVDNDDGFGDFAEPTKIEETNQNQVMNRNNNVEVDDDGFGDFEEATLPSIQPTQFEQQQQQSAQNFNQNNNNNNNNNLPREEIGTAMKAALSEMSQHFSISKTQIWINQKSPSSSSYRQKFAELKEKRKRNLTSSPSSFNLVSALTSNVNSILTATHRGAIVGSVQDVIEHERQSFGKVQGILPIITTTGSSRKILQPIDLENFVKIVCW